MVFNCIAIALSVSFLVLSVTAAATEGAYIRKAAVRNFFRRLRITLRELSPFAAAVIAAVYVLISLKLKEPDMWLTVNVLAAFGAGYFILNFHRLHGFAAPKRRKSKRSRLLSTPETGAVGELGELNTLTECSELTPAETGTMAE